jgi:hypothetical protein
MEFDGQVVRKAFAPGTKSEHEALYVEGAEGRFVLRRVGANPFDIDPELRGLIGRRVRFTGTLTAGYTLLVSDWKILDEEER